MVAGEGSKLSGGLSAAEYVFLAMWRKFDEECEKIVSRPYSYDAGELNDPGNQTEPRSRVSRNIRRVPRFEKRSMDCWS